MNGDPPLRFRRPVAVLLSRFPTVTETFILREVIELERQGQPVRLVPLLRDDPPVVHPEALPWMDRALFTPFLSIRILRANLQVLVRKPFRYLGLLVRMMCSSLLHPRFLLGTLAYFPKSVYLASRLSAEGVRHVHAHFASHPSSAALVISAFSDISFSITVHAHDLFVARYTPFLDLKLRSASFIRVISEFNRKYLMDNYPEVAPEKVKVVHVGVPTDAYSSGESDESANSRERSEPLDPWEGHDGVKGAIRILAVAGLRPYKGLPVLVEACRLLGTEGIPVQCRIIGEGPMQEALENQIEEAGVEGQVKLLGALPQGEVARHLRGGPIFVLPSVILRDRMMDGIPVALMEAMASGVPVVASGLSGIPELVEDGVSGILLDPGDSQGIAAAVQRLAADPALAESLGSAGAAKVREDFSLDGCVERLLYLIDEENPPHGDLLSGLLPPDLEADRSLKPSLANPYRPQSGVRVLHEGPDSQVVEVLVAGPREPLRRVVKTHTHRAGESRPPHERAHHEFEVMETLSSSWGEAVGPGPVPAPVELRGREGRLIMESSPGRRLDELLQYARWGDRSGLAEAESGMEKTGEWLGRFQDVMRPAVQKAGVVEAWVAELDRSLGMVRAFLPLKLWSRAGEAVRSLRADSSRESFGVTGHHGDFWPGNVLVTPSGVQVVDFEGFRPGLDLEDPAYFLLHFEFSLNLPGCRRHLQRLSSAFWQGLGRGDLSETWEYRLSRVSVSLRLLSMFAVNPGMVGGDQRRKLRQIRRALAEALA